MNYIKKSDKTHIDYFIYQNNVYFKEENCVIKLDKNLNRKVIFTKSVLFIIEGIIDNNLCIRDKTHLSYIDLRSEIQSKIIPLNFQNSIQIKYQENNFIILRNQINEIEWKIFCIDSFGNIIWQRNNSRPFFSQGDLNNSVIFLFLEDKKINVYTINDGLSKWQLSFLELLNSEKAYLNGGIIESNNKLYFIVSGMDDGGLFCVDAETGKVLN